MIIRRSLALSFAVAVAFGLASPASAAPKAKAPTAKSYKTRTPKKALKRAFPGLQQIVIEQQEPDIATFSAIRDGKEQRGALRSSGRTWHITVNDGPSSSRSHRTPEDAFRKQMADLGFQNAYSIDLVVIRRLWAGDMITATGARRSDGTRSNIAGIIGATPDGFRIRDVTVVPRR